MKSFFIVFITLFVNSSFAAADHIPESKNSSSEFNSQWRFGVGLGVQSQLQEVAEVEIGTGELFHYNESGFSLIVSYKGGDTIQENPQNEHYSVHSYKVMLESQHHGFNPYSNTYARLGVGYTDTVKLFHPDGGFLIVPVQLGMDTKVMQTDTSYLAFYVQAGSEINFLSQSKPAKNFDGISLTVGFRGYY